MTDSGQAEAMCFFEYISIKHLNEYQPCESWKKTLMFFSQTVPAVRYAAMALALVHRNHMDLDSGWPTDKAPVFYYNRAIQLLLNQEGDDNTEIMAVTLLVCYLFTCFDYLTGNDVQALKHLGGGVELSKTIDRGKMKDGSASRCAGSSEISTLISHVTRQIRRLDMQAGMFLVDWTPTDMLDASPPSDSAFQSLNQAADQLQILLARVMRLYITEQQLSLLGEMPPLLSSSLKAVVLEQLETWSGLFENCLQQGNCYETHFEAHSLASRLRLQYSMAWILLRGYGPGREMDYDDYLPQFQQCVALACDVATAHERFSQSLKPTFTPEIGVIPVLYVIGVKCRHPVVRRNALNILRRQPVREAAWDSISIARIVERVIEIEEGGFEITQSMERIPVWQRIEALSWVHVDDGGQSATRLEIIYTFCAQEGVHVESLVL